MKIYRSRFGYKKYMSDSEIAQFLCSLKMQWPICVIYGEIYISDKSAIAYYNNRYIVYTKYGRKFLYLPIPFKDNIYTRANSTILTNSFAFIYYDDSNDEWVSFEVAVIRNSSSDSVDSGYYKYIGEL